MPPIVDAKAPVSVVMGLQPATIRVFLRHHMLCVGCPVARLHSLEDACSAHGLDLDTIVAEIERISR